MPTSGTETHLRSKMVLIERSGTCPSPDSITMLASKDLNRRPVGIISIPTGYHHHTMQRVEALPPLVNERNTMVQKTRAPDSPLKRTRTMTDKHRSQVQRISRCKWLVRKC